MKRILLIIAFIFAIGTSKAQDSVVYKSVLGDSITEWYNLIAYSGVWAETGRYTVITGDTAMMGDTIYRNPPFVESSNRESCRCGEE